MGLPQIANVLPTTHAFAAARDVLDGQGRAMGAPRALAARDGGGTRRASWFGATMLKVFRSRGFVTRNS